MNTTYCESQSDPYDEMPLGNKKEWTINTYATTQVTLNYTERSQTKKSMYCMIPFV